jgi:DNA-directed RNA polymerases I, II, and III subunit RPABC5
MMFPVRCFTCNKVIGNKWDTYTFNISEGLTPEQNFEKLNVKRYCCKRMFLGHVEVIDKLLLYPDKECVEK